MGAGVVGWVDLGIEGVFIRVVGVAVVFGIGWKLVGSIELAC